MFETYLVGQICKLCSGGSGSFGKIGNKCLDVQISNKFSNKCLSVPEWVEVVDWNKRWSPAFP